MENKTNTYNKDMFIINQKNILNCAYYANILIQLIDENKIITKERFYNFFYVKYIDGVRITEADTIIFKLMDAGLIIEKINNENKKFYIKFTDDVLREYEDIIYLVTEKGVEFVENVSLFIEKNPGILKKEKERQEKNSTIINLILFGLFPILGIILYILAFTASSIFLFTASIFIGSLLFFPVIFLWYDKWND